MDYRDTLMQLCVFSKSYTLVINSTPMASSFSPKNYFKKIYSPEVLVEFYKKHEVLAFFEISDQTPRKRVVEIFMETYITLPPEQKIDIEKELALINTLSTKYSVALFLALLKKKKLPFEETTLECQSDQDKVLYYYLFNKDVFDEVMFFHDFYINRGYMLYEAKEVDMVKAELSITEFAKECNRIANKEDRTTECEVVAESLDGILYVEASFEGAPQLTPTKDKVTGELDRARTTRKQETVRIVYLPADKEVLISYTGSKYEKLVFLDTFLRIVCDCGYDAKVESFDLSSFKKQDFDFTKTNKGVPLLTWKIKAVTLAFGDGEKSKKKMRLTVPSTMHEYGLSPLFSTLDEIGIVTKIGDYTVENVALSFSFSDKKNSEKSVQVGCSLSRIKSSLSPLFPYDRYARSLLKQAGMDQGFVEGAKKEAEDMSKKWEA